MEDIKKKKVLMTLMRLDIGGAETHVLELSLELKRQGFDVVVASNGGVYVPVLEEAGIRHYKVPMYTKSPDKMLQSLSQLRRIIREENIDIVHAHGRIPAFLCGILNHFMPFTFVTTAHWVFKTSHGLKYLSDWGKKVVAVSEDIKTYLMVNYHINPTDIFVTINGIDTEKFSPHAQTEDIIQEFALQKDSRKIVYISRMDEDRALVAFHLVEIAPKLLEKQPDLEIVIVGGGNVFEKLKERADAANAAAGHKYITLTGGRSDIYKFANLGDIFVGVSRSALEAMACAKPVIVAGNEGYIGIFDEDKLAVGIDTNFCCRGLEQSSPQLLLRDLNILLDNPREENERLGNYGRELIKKDYSVKRMADDAVKMYCAAVDPKRFDAVISGYYGFENSGDEALLYAMVQNLRELCPEIRLCVLSKSPKKTAEAYGVYSVNRYGIHKLRKVIGSGKLLISGGGSLLQDVTSSKSLWYYLSVMKIAKKLGVKVMIYANGIGPIHREKNRKNAQKVLSHVDFITLREENSVEELKSLGITGDHIRVTADPALTIVPSQTDTAKKLLFDCGVPEGSKLMGISLRAWKNCRADFAQQTAEAIDRVCSQNGLTPLFLPLKFPEDVQFSAQVAAKMRTKSYVLAKRISAENIISVIGCCRIMLAMRLHSLIYAADTCVPTVGIDYDPKVSAFMKYLGMDYLVPAESLTTEQLTAVLDEVLANEKLIHESLQNHAELLKAKARESAQIALDLIRGEE